MFQPEINPDSDFPARMSCQDLVDMLVSLGMTAVYVTTENYRPALARLDKNTVLVHIGSEGEDVTLLGDNEIDHVRFRFRHNGEHIRA